MASSTHNENAPMKTNNSEQIKCSLGYDRRGKEYCTTLNNLESLLLIGCTGTGKSKCIHHLIRSIIDKNDDQLNIKFIFIDVMQVEYYHYRKEKFALNLGDISDSDKVYYVYNELLKRNNSQSKQAYDPLVLIIDGLCTVINNKDIVKILYEIIKYGAKNNIYLIMTSQIVCPMYIFNKLLKLTKSHLIFTLCSEEDEKFIFKQTGILRDLDYWDFIFLQNKFNKKVLLNCKNKQIK